VASFPSGNTATGIFDMAGNVWEFTATGYASRYGQPRDDASVADRGGAWNSVVPGHVRAPGRDSPLKTSRANNLGFRCAK